MKNILLFVFALFIFSDMQSQNLFFNHLDVKDGLSHSTIQSIYQDEYGQIWFATRNGLNKYDGNNIQRVNIKVAGYDDFFFNNISKVAGNGKGQMFIVSMQRLIVFDTGNYKFYIPKGQENQDIRAIHYSKNKLWIATGNTLSYINENADIKEHLTLDYKVDITRIEESSDGTLYLGTDAGLFKVDMAGNQTVLVDNISVTCIYEDSKKQIWIGTLQDGLYVYNRLTGIENFKKNTSAEKGPSSNFIRSIVEDNLGKYWIGTYAGLNCLDHNQLRFTNYTHSVNNSNSISDFSVHSIMKDQQGSLWIGTNFGGVNFTNPEFSFNRYYTIENGLSGEIVSNVAEDAKGNLWICTDNAGLNYLDRSRQTISHIKHTPGVASSLTSNALKASLIDEENNCLWLGSNVGGLDKVDLSTHRVERIPLNTNNPNIDKFVRAILKYEDKLILGTHNSVQLYDIGNKKTTPFLGENFKDIRQVWDMLLDSKNNLWFSSGANVYCVNMETKSVTEIHKEIGNNSLSVFFEDRNGNIWIGTAGQGLFCYNPSTDIYKRYTTTDSKISDNYILDIAESASGTILLTTNTGLCTYDPVSNIFHNYLLNQFFPFKAFNERSIHITQKGEIVLSSFNGMIIIDEKDLKITPKSYLLNFTDLSVNNQIVQPNDDTKILKTSIHKTDTIYLHESHSIFSIDVYATNYLNTINPQIRYQLEGFDEQWVNLKSGKTISYTNLMPKTYTLKVYAVDDFSEYTTPIKELTIIVKPYFFKTWYAYILYGLLLIGIIYVCASRIFLKQSLKYAEYKAAHIQEVNQSKMRFFINVSHEIRTPVTLISAQLEYILADLKANPTIHNRLLNMRRNTHKLRDLINELLDFRKQEIGTIILNIEEVEVMRYLKNILYTFREYGQSLKIASRFSTEIEETTMYFDSVQMDKVFYNLLSNAFKYTPEGGEVNLSIKLNDNCIIIEVADTGIGIKPALTNEIFDRFYQIEDKESKFTPRDPGAGIGLSLVKSIIEQHHGTISVSSNGVKGSIFTVSLPLGYAHFENDENARFALYADANTIDDITSNNRPPIDEMEKEKLADKKILVYIVEDNEDIQSILTDIFDPLYTVKSFGDAESAYKNIETDLPNLIILDVMLPKMSGIELCSKLKANLATLHIPIILLTAAAGTENRIEGLLKGADDYIYKPFDSNELIVRSANLIKSRQSLFASTNVESGSKAAYGRMSKRDTEFMHKFEAIVKDNLDNPALNVDQLSAEMYMSRTTLFARLKEIAAITPNKYILDIRMASALEMLKRDRDIIINDLAYNVGFHTPSYFINQFKNHYGVTPNEFKKSYFNVDQP